MAAVTATNTATGVSYPATTNEVGAYTIGALPTGRYTVRFKADGFKEFVRENVSLATGDIARIDPSFELGSLVDQGALLRSD